LRKFIFIHKDNRKLSLRYKINRELYFPNVLLFWRNNFI